MKSAAAVIRYLLPVLVFGVSTISAQSLDEQKDALIKEGSALTYSARYNEAIEHMRKLEEIDPDCAEGLFFEAFVLELVMDVYRSQAFDDSLNRVLERGLVKAKRAVEKNPTARNYMFLGGLYGVRGVRKGILGDWFGTAMDGRRAFKQMEKSIKLDPENYDCYYGIGSYHYWRTKKLRRFFPFLSDQREKGINELQLSIDNGVFSPPPSRFALFRIYIEEKWYDKVLTLAEEMITANPDHIFPRWYYGIALIRLEKWDEALENYQFIRKYIDDVPFRGIEADIETWYYMGMALYQLDRAEEAKELLEKTQPYKDQVNKNLFYYEDYIKESRELIKKINKELASG